MNIEVGTRINCILPHAGEGIVFDCDGIQAPATVRQLGGGVVVMGGNAVFDVVFANGHVSRKLPEAVIRGVQWSICDGKADAEEIAAALANAACVKAANASAEEMKAVKLAAEIAALKANADHAKLTQGQDYYSGKLAAKNIRVELKAAFPSVRFSVTKRSHGAVNVAWTDGPTDAQVSAITGKYQSGSFDGMQDLYTSAPDAWNKVFGGADYVFTRRELSLALKQRAIDELFATSASVEGIEKPTAETFGRGYVTVPGENYCLADLIYQRAVALEG